MKNQVFVPSLSDILLLLGVRGLSGELTIESGNNLGTVMFYQGKILHAASPYSRAIGDLLVEDGIITESELIETLKLQKRSAYAPLGSILTKMGKVSFEIIEMMVHEQVRSAMKEFLTWDQVNCTFTDKNLKPLDSIRINVQEFIPQPLLQSARTFIISGQTSEEPLQTDSNPVISEP